MENMNNITVQVSLLVFLLSFATPVFTQNSDSCNLKFINHLVNKGNYEEALFLLDSTDCLSFELNDSIYYLRGWSLYSLKRLLPSSENLIKVRPASEFYLKSHFFAAYNYIYTGKYNNAFQTLSDISLSSAEHISLKNFELAGIYLLKGDTVRFEESFGKTDNSFYGISESSDNLHKIIDDLTNHKKRSPVIAGLLSGIIPGSGKLYSGKRGEAVSSFIATTALGLITWENYRKSGMKSFNTIAFGTAFAFSYAANIYGAILTVNIIETEYRENVKNSILFNLHIPLRNSFDR
jgi:hypothetical protein